MLHELAYVWQIDATCFTLARCLMWTAIFLVNLQNGIFVLKNQTSYYNRCCSKHGRELYSTKLYPEMIITLFNGCVPHFYKMRISEWWNRSTVVTYWWLGKIHEPKWRGMITPPSFALGIAHLFAFTCSCYRSFCLSAVVAVFLRFSVLVSFHFSPVNPVLPVCLSPAPMSVHFTGNKYHQFSLFPKNKPVKLFH